MKNNRTRNRIDYYCGSVKKNSDLVRNKFGSVEMLRSKKGGGFSFMKSFYS